ncbi:MAG: tyrosine-type recombinase/integrase [Mediterraneibacter sp.]|mgnify:FL=1
MASFNLRDNKLSKNSEYLFSEGGKRVRSNAFNRRLTRVCDELHLKHRSMHKIRKTYGTTLLDANVDESTVAEQMGHKDIATTKRFYYRSNKSDNTKLEQINRALSC